MPGFSSTERHFVWRTSYDGDVNSYQSLGFKGAPRSMSQPPVPQRYVRPEVISAPPGYWKKQLPTSWRELVENGPSPPC